MAESYPPLAGIPQSLKIKWYRSPVDRDVLKGLVARSDLKGRFKRWDTWPWRPPRNPRLPALLAPDLGRIRSGAVHPRDRLFLLHAGRT